MIVFTGYVGNIFLVSGIIGLSDALMSALAMFQLKYPSLLALDKGRTNKESKNLRQVFHIRTIPSDTCMRETLDEVSPTELQGLFGKLDKIGLTEIALSAVTVMELFQGMGNKNELARMKKKIKFYDVVQMDNALSEKAIEFVETYKLSHGLYSAPIGFVHLNLK